MWLRNIYSNTILYVAVHELLFLSSEWHAGQSGSLRLRDEDNTSKQEGSWVRLNTLAHYNVQDGSNMALIDPQIDDQHQEQDYGEYK